MKKLLIIICTLSSLDIYGQGRDSVTVQDNRSVIILQDNRSINIQQNNFQQNNVGNYLVQREHNEKKYKEKSQIWRVDQLFNHLDASLTLGTTGIGFDLATPVGDYAQLRVGYAFMPSFHKSMYFGVQVGDTPENKYDANGNRIETKFEKMARVLKQVTGYEAQDEVEMIGRPLYHNLKVMVDVFPFQQDKRWHVTAGFFLGPSKIAEAYNSTEAMPSLLAVGVYNSFRERTLASYEEGWPYPPVISVAGWDLTDEKIIEELAKRFQSYGRMGMRVGNFDDGSAYLMEPGDDGMVRASMKVNAFKPYLGIGYGGRLLKNNDRFHIAVDLGAMFWGGSPRIVTHEGVDLTRDVSDISGKVGDYVRLAKIFKVMPVLDVRFVYNIF